MYFAFLDGLGRGFALLFGAAIYFIFTDRFSNDASLLPAMSPDWLIAFVCILPNTTENQSVSSNKDQADQPNVITLPLSLLPKTNRNVEVFAPQDLLSREMDKYRRPWGIAMFTDYMSIS
jgi:hypothetical protein